MPKLLRIITGIISFLYFSVPYFIEGMNYKSDSFSFYAFSFVPVWVYNAFYNLTPLKHIVPFIGLVIAACIFWFCISRLCMAIYDIYLDIYLNKKRFDEDRDLDS